MPVWTLWQYPNVVTDFMDRARADLDMQAEMIGRIVALVEQGHMLGMPAAEPVGRKTGLFALRAKSRTRQGRLFYFFAVGQRIVFVHSVDAKKTRAFEQRDIDLAMKRRREIERFEDITRAIKQFRVQDNDNQTH